MDYGTGQNELFVLVHPHVQTAEIGASDDGSLGGLLSQLCRIALVFLWVGLGLVLLASASR